MLYHLFHTYLQVGISREAMMAQTGLRWMPDLELALEIMKEENLKYQIIQLSDTIEYILLVLQMNMQLLLQNLK